MCFILCTLRYHIEIRDCRKENYGTCEYLLESVRPSLTSNADSTSNQRIIRSARRGQEAYCYPNAHPITQLPSELLGHIFVLGSEDDTQFPIVVSHVCKIWRVIALHTPSLWRRISLDSRKLMWVERVRRAKVCTLDVEIRPQLVPVCRRTSRRSYLDARSVELYVHLVSPFIYRWRSLHIEFQHYAPYLWNAALSSCCAADDPRSVEASNLEHLSLIHPLNDDPKEFLLFGGYTPRLRSATLHGIRLMWLPSLFANLTSLDYTHHGFTCGSDAYLELYCMLQVCSKLQNLRLAFPQNTHRTTSKRRCPREVPTHR